MKQKQFVKETDLTGLAKIARKKSQLSKAELGRQLDVTRGAIHQAEECADMSFTKLRIKIIEKCSTTKVTGPFYQIETSK